VVMIGTVFAYSENYEFKSFVDYYLFFKDEIRWENIINDENFDAYKDDFLIVAEIALKNVDIEKEYNFLVYDVDYYTKERCLYSYQQEKRIELTEKEFKSVNSIRYAFTVKDAQLEIIRVYGNRVLFCTNNGQYSVVYSLDDSVPTYVNAPEEIYDVFTKKICAKWYHVVINAETKGDIERNVEEAFDAIIPDRAISGLKTVQDVLDYLVASVNP